VQACAGASAAVYPRAYMYTLLGLVLREILRRALGASIPRLANRECGGRHPSAVARLQYAVCAGVRDNYFSSLLGYTVPGT